MVNVGDIVGADTPFGWWPCRVVGTDVDHYVTNTIMVSEVIQVSSCYLARVLYPWEWKALTAKPQLRAATP